MRRGTYAETLYRYARDMDHARRLKLFDTARAEHGRFLEAVLWRLTGDRELFVEALQESLLLVWRHAEKLEGQAGRSYVYRVAQSAASLAWRRKLRAGHELPCDGQDPCEEPGDQISRNEMLALVRQAVSELPQQQGRAITMRYLEQMSYQAMAREMDCSEVTLRSHVSKALTALRKALAPRESGV